MFSKIVQDYLKVKNLVDLAVKDRFKKCILLAVSKTKTVQQIMEVYKTGHRDFGQNYVNEIQEKSKSLPKDIRWHFIGHLQSNKVKNLLDSNPYMLHSLDSIKLSNVLQKQLNKRQTSLNVLIQVKTSDEDSKSGVQEKQLISLVQHVLKDCPSLVFKGLMTIGKEGDLQAFKQMRELKERVVDRFKLQGEQLQLSMGMSGDFEVAIKEGSSIVRVGSSIFGVRH